MPDPEYTRRRAALLRENSEAIRQAGVKLSEALAALRAEFGVELPTIDQITGSDPNFTGGLGTDLHMRELTGRGTEDLLALRAALQALVDGQNARIDHGFEYTDHEEADAALIAYIDDPEVTRLFEALGRWYS